MRFFFWVATTTPSGKTDSGKSFKISKVIKSITIRYLVNRNGLNQLF